MTTYTVDWPRYWQLQSGDKYGGYDCSAHVLAAGLRVDSGITTTGARVRQLSNEPVPDPSSPGLNHEQLKDVAAKFGVALSVKYRVPWAEVLDISAAGHAIALGVNYAPIRTSSYTGQTNFTGNHELLLLPGHFTFDPLADGRNIGIYTGPGRYPDSLLKDAAGKLVLSYINGIPKVRLGAGLAYIAIFPHRHLTQPAPDTGGIVTDAPTPAERNVMITTTAADYRFKLPKGQPLYRHPGGPIVTRMSVAGAVEWTGNAGTGWTAVQVNTKAPYADGQTRPTIVYVPTKAGVRV